MPSRGKLSVIENRSIERKLPKLTGLVETVLALTPDLISIGFSPSSLVPIASVCLRDATDVLSDVKYALFEAYAHKRWYEKHEPKDNDWVGIHFARFYTDDACLRLYSTGEHLASAIINMYELPKTDFKKSRSHRGASRLSRVGSYLSARRPAEKLTTALQALLNSKEWQSTVDYRNNWVHTQPALISGVGIVYKRRNRWTVSNGGMGVSFGGGDQPEISINQLLSFVQPSTKLLTKALRISVASYVKLLGPAGIRVTRKN